MTKRPNADPKRQLADKLNELQDQIDWIKRQLGDSTSGPNGSRKGTVPMTNLSSDGSVIGTAKGMVTPYDAGVGHPHFPEKLVDTKPITWTKLTGGIRKVGDGNHELQLPGDGMHALHFTVTGKWPAGYHNYYPLTFATLAINPQSNFLGGPKINTGGGLSTKIGSLVLYPGLEQTIPFVGTIQGYGNAVMLGLKAYHASQPANTEPGAPIAAKATEVNVFIEVQTLIRG